MQTTKGQNGKLYDTTTTYYIDTHLRALSKDLKKALDGHDIKSVKWHQNEIDILLDARLKTMPGKHRYIEATEKGIPL